jgi:CubicO group peptidase (beta-lactamase class C family)
MTFPKKNILYTLVSIVLFYSCKNEQKEITSKKHINYTEIDSLFVVSNERGIFNGSAIVSINNTSIYNNSLGYTDGSKTKNLNNSSIFKIGSIAKEINAVSIMILVEKGQLSFDDTIDKFNLGLPEWSKKVKIKHLLQYSSGLPQINYEKVKNNQDVYQDLKNLKKLNFEPGTNYRYNNNSIFIQKRIIEKVTNLSFEEYVTQNIILPLNLKNAQFDTKEDDKNYVKSFNNNGINDEFKNFTTGWLDFTNEDLHTYVNALHSEKLISNTSLEILLKNRFQNNQTSLGYSEFKDNELVNHSHQGSSRNFEAYIFHNKQSKLTITLTTNNKNFKLGEITNAIEMILNNKEYDIPKKSVYLATREAFYVNVDEGFAYYNQLKTKFPEMYNFSDSRELNEVGYKLIGKGRLVDAIKVFELIVKEFPEDSNAYDSLGEAYMLNKQDELAIKNYKKSLTLNPENKNAAEKITEINNR